MGAGEAWQMWEDDIIIKYYPDAPYESLTDALPDRGLLNIRARASKLNVKREKEVISRERYKPIPRVQNEIRAQELWKTFCRYIGSSKEVLEKVNRGATNSIIKPDVDSMLRAFREEYGDSPLGGECRRV